MGTLAVPLGDPFKDHLLAVLSPHDAPHAATATVPRYSGPRDWQTDAMLRKVEALLSSRRIQDGARPARKSGYGALATLNTPYVEDFNGTSPA
ncbi:hypothetical protein B0H13DRAFT_2310334 [Mycena leptocephala]|nr:hypothetical protein B0H13DRAFT_2310334 [Mycena leptocephala]